MQMGSSGELYLLEYGTPWYDGTDGRLKKITCTESPIEIDVTAADPKMSGLDLEHPGAKLIGQTTGLACHTNSAEIDRTIL